MRSSVLRMNLQSALALRKAHKFPINSVCPIKIPLLHGGTELWCFRNEKADLMWLSWCH